MQTVFPALVCADADAMRFLRVVAEDIEEAPWMVMNDRQWREASALYWSLYSYKQAQGLPWYVGGMLPLFYRPPDAQRAKAVTPDLFVALIDDHPRDALQIAEEGMPSTVLEVVSRSSVEHDVGDKARLYRLLGVEEYAIVRLDLAVPHLEGYRRTTGMRVPWERDGEGQLWSAVLWTLCERRYPLS